MSSEENSPNDEGPRQQIQLPLEVVVDAEAQRDAHEALDAPGGTSPSGNVRRSGERKKKDLSGAEAFISRVGPDTGYVRKPHQTILIRPKDGRLTLQSRRWYNVFIRHLQLNKPAPGERASIPMGQFLEDTRTERLNNEYIAKVLEVLLTTVVEWGDTNTKLEGKQYRWEAATLLSYAAIIKDDRGRRVEFDIDRSMRELVMTPEGYAKVSLDVQDKMSCHAALMLYELGTRYYAPSKGEMRSLELPWREWVVPMSGSKERDVASLEYKTFVRDLLKPALLDVNNPAFDIPFTIRVEERRVGRAVGFIRFVIAPRRAEHLSTLGTDKGVQVEVQHLSLIGRLINLKVPQAEAEAFYQRYGHDRLRIAIEAVERRRVDDPIKNPVTYFREVLRKAPAQREADDNIVDVKVTVRADAPKVSPTPLLMKLRRLYAAEQRAEGEGVFNELTPALKREDFEKFERDMLGSQRGPVLTAWQDFRKKGLDAKMPAFVAEPFFKWYLSDRPQPNDDELLLWGQKRGHITDAIPDGAAD